jgi:hypothetical protein
VTVAVPLKPLYVAVMVTALVVFCRAFTTPVPLTVTNVPSVSELSQTASPVTSFVLPSLLFATAVSWRVPPICRLLVEGLTVTEVTVGFTKKPVHPVAIATAATALTSRYFRLEFQIMKTP